jgi:hypothetical protein
VAVTTAADYNERAKEQLVSGQFIDLNAPSLQGPRPKGPEDLPHGLLRPPDRVRELVAQEKAKHPAERFTSPVEEQLINDWTVDYYFDYLGYEVLYRRTPEGPEVLAVGFEEIRARTNDMGPEKMMGLNTRLPY